MLSAKLDLSYLTDVNQETNEDGEPQDDKTAFDRLVLEDGHASMIVSLISQHFRDKKSATAQGEQFDIVKGKGNSIFMR